MNLFPITGDRASEGAQGAQLNSEGPLLLNPFEDNPAEHFHLNDQCILIPTSERGKTTIELYRLNGDFFIHRRKEILNNYLEHFKALSKAGGDELEYYDLLLKESQVSRPQDAMVLDVILRKLTGESPRSRRSKNAERNSDKVSQDARSIPKKFEATWITSVRVRDFGAIKELALKFPEFSSELEPWLGIVGENGVGKSTFLKAVALALVDSETAKNLIPDASRVHNRDSRNRIGYVEVKLSDGRTRRVTFRRNSKDFEFSGEEVRLPVIALGANRITGTIGTARTLRVSSAVNNLFDPVLPLADAEDWLSNTSIVSAQDFSAFGQNLKDLMDLPLSTRVTRREGRIFFQYNGSRQSLDQMSDGFRAVIGLTTHIMKYLAADTPVMSEAEGTVLLDELELHLHPLWKRRIVSKLRQIFPHVRFVITTHDPLCLQGLALDESYVFRRNHESDTIEAQALNILPGMDVDDLLTGGWFGLATTYDEETENMIHDLSALSLRADQLRVHGGASLSETEQIQLEKLSRDLRERLPTSSGIVSTEFLEVDAEALQARLKRAFGRSEE